MPSWRAFLRGGSSGDFTKSIRERIITLAWWDWEHDRLAVAVADMQQLKIQDFLKKYE